jgi:LysR family nitrogen assimilation transcriptional regulator
VDLKQLRYFAKIAEQGSFSQGARTLHIAQPALSHHIRQLEEELGVVLFERHARGVRLTEPGARLLDHARLVLRQLETAHDDVTNLADKPRGTVRLGLASAVGAVLAVPLFEAAHQRFPEIDLRIIETLSGFLKELVLNGRLDMALLYNVDGRDGFRAESLLHEDLYLIAPVKDRVARRRMISFKELETFPLVLPGTAHGLRLLVDSLATAAGIRLNVAVELDSTPITVSMIARGGYYSVLSPSSVRDAIARREVRAIPIVKPAVTRSVVVVTPTSRVPTRAGEAIQQLITDVARQLVAEKIWSARFLA